MKYLIAGRTGSGKDFLAEKLMEYGLTAVKSYTTRPKRTDDEDSHIFITKEDADTITDKVATTTINGYEYFATKSQVESSDIYIIDPNGIYELAKNMPDTTFHLIYVMADDMDRKLHAVSRAEDKIKEELVFDDRDKSECIQFYDFEKELEDIRHGIDSTNIPENITQIEIYNNGYDEAETNKMAKFYYNQLVIHNRITDIIDEMSNSDMDFFKNAPEEDVNGVKKIKITIEDTPHIITEEHLADIFIAHKSDFSNLMMNYIVFKDEQNRK